MSKYYLFFDTETTGLPKNFSAPPSDTSNWPNIVQLAWIIYNEKGEKISEFSYIMKPDGYEIPEDASKIHGITNSIALEKGKDTRSILGKFIDDLNKYNPVLIAHNIAFDEKILAAALIRCRMKNILPNYRKYCTMTASIDYCDLPNKKYPKLEELYEKIFKEKPEKTHDALNDALITAKCYFKLKETLNFTEIEDEIHKSSGPVLLLAGPGTGKTHRLAKRIKYLVEDRGVNPDEITVITFTAAAATNMQEKISNPSKQELFVIHDKQPNIIRTIHSLGHKIIKEKSADLGLSDKIGIVNSDKIQNIIIGDAAQLAGQTREVGKETSKCRQFGKCTISQETKCKICEQYNNILRKCSAIDHNDQILLACKVLNDYPELRDKYSSKCKNLLVDEYQDINAGQYELISLLSGENKTGLFVVGDDDQSIYSWRGGSPEFIREFESNYGESAQVIRLQKSFRCPPHILEGALSIVEGYDSNRLPKGHFEYKTEEGNKIFVHNVPSEKKEAKAIRSLVEKSLPSKRVLILIPRREFLVNIVEELRKAKLPYTAPTNMPGQGLPIFSSLSNWLRDNSDSLSLRECIDKYINTPNSGIPSSLSRKKDKLDEREEAHNIISKMWQPVIEGKHKNLWESICKNKDKNPLLKNIYSIFSELHKLHNSKDAVGFISEAIKHLVPWKKPKHFLDEVDIWIKSSIQIAHPEHGSGAQIMTFQGAKGLEADIVCIVGAEEDVIPKIGTDVSEQSRLMFVSFTRAIEELHVFHARKRSGSIMFKKIFKKKGEPPDIKRSRFIDSIPKEHKEEVYSR